MSSTQSFALEEIAGGEDRQARARQTRARKARTFAVMGAAVGVLVLGVLFVIYNISDAYSSSNIKSEYETAYEAYVTSVGQLDESLGSITQTLDECHGSVADENVCVDLERLNGRGLELSNQRLDKATIHDKTVDEIRTEISRLSDAQSVVEQTREALIAALEPIAQSQVDKIKIALNDAIKNAESVIAQSQQIVDTAKNEVKDPSTREAVLEAIRSVRAQIESVKAVTGTDTAPYVGALNALNQSAEDLTAKANAVVYSHQLWEQERRAAEAEASASAEAKKKAEEEKKNKGETPAANAPAPRSRD